MQVWQHTVLCNADFFWLGMSMGKRDILDKKCKVWKSFSGCEDRVNRFISVCSSSAHFRGCFSSWITSTLRNGKGESWFFSFHNKELKVVETDAAWDLGSSSSLSRTSPESWFLVSQGWSLQSRLGTEPCGTQVLLLPRPELFHFPLTTGNSGVINVSCLLS